MEAMNENTKNKILYNFEKSLHLLLVSLNYWSQDQRHEEMIIKTFST